MNGPPDLDSTVAWVEALLVAEHGAHAALLDDAGATAALEPLRSASGPGVEFSFGDIGLGSEATARAASQLRRRDLLQVVRAMTALGPVDLAYLTGDGPTSKPMYNQRWTIDPSRLLVIRREGRGLPGADADRGWEPIDGVQGDELLDVLDIRQLVEPVRPDDLADYRRLAAAVRREGSGTHE